MWGLKSNLEETEHYKNRFNHVAYKIISDHNLSFVLCIYTAEENKLLLKMLYFLLVFKCIQIATKYMFMYSQWKIKRTLLNWFRYQICRPI